MTYDLDFRYRRALQPDGLALIATSAQAVQDAMTDARNAGLDPERDPAVILLARHLGRVASARPADTVEPLDAPLRAACLERLAELKARPALVALVRRGVDYDPEAKRAFRREATRALRQIAAEIGLASDQFEIHADNDRSGPAGDVALVADGLHVRITADNFRSGREITYWRSRSRHDEFGGPTYHADIGQIADLPRFARTIIKTLGPIAGCNPAALFAGER